jgi:RHS repeat-associated protein
VKVLACADQRFYASSYGRFNTPDQYVATGGGTGDPDTPGSWNRYAYVIGDPVNFSDPNGTCGGPSISGTRADGTIYVSVWIPRTTDNVLLGLPVRTTAPQPPPHLTIADYDDFHGILPKCPSVTKAPPGLDAAQIQKNIDAAQQYLSNALVNDTEGQGFFQFLGYLTAQFAPRGAWDYKSDPQYGPSARDFGNFNFGAVLASTGATYYQTQNAAGVAQIGICIFGGACGTGVSGFVFPYGDQVGDASLIKKGWTYENAVMTGCKP